MQYKNAALTRLNTENCSNIHDWAGFDGQGSEDGRFRLFSRPVKRILATVPAAEAAWGLQSDG